MQQDYITPPLQYKKTGSERRVGFEIELGHLSVDEIVEIIKESYQSEVCSTSEVEKLVHTDLGDIKVEIDWQYLKSKAEQCNDENDILLRPLIYLASKIVPLEIVCPPVKISEMSKFDKLIKKLREQGANGSKNSFLSAYGVHINVELPDLDANTILMYLKSFSLLQDALMELHDVDLTRKTSPFINLYPKNYVNKILNKESYSFEDLFEDYLAFNATRNRAMDMLPLLAYINSEKVSKFIEDERIHPRPTIHYRMPNSNIDQKDWSLSKPWNVWCVVEKLATNTDDLKYLISKFSKFGNNSQEWCNFLSEWLHKNKYV